MSRHRSGRGPRWNARSVASIARAPRWLVLTLVAATACRPAPVRASRPKRNPYVADTPANVDVAPGLTYRQTTCGPARTVVREVRFAPRAEATGELEFRVVHNPTAHRDVRCLERYGGTDIRGLADGMEAFRVLAFVNGNFFHDVPGGFRSNGMLWSRPDGLIAPVESTLDADYRGDRLVLVDAQGVGDRAFATGECEPGRCRSALGDAQGVVPTTAVSDLDDQGLVDALRGGAPTMTAAMQLTPAYEPEEGCPLCERTVSSYVRCEPGHRWTCDPHSVTLLCLHADRSLSMIVAEKAEYAPLMRAMRAGGTCGTECSMLYLLDGGGSSQIGFRDPREGSLRMAYAGKFDASPAAGCPTFRPVDHYLVVGRRTGGRGTSPQPVTQRGPAH